MNLYIVSYKRWELVRTYEYLGYGKIVVPKSQAPLYRERYGDAVLPIDDELDGSISKKRNAVLDIIQQQSNPYGWVLDDDIEYLMWKKPKRELSGEECLEMLEITESCAVQLGAKYSGFDFTEDNKKLMDYQPFSMTKRGQAGIWIDPTDGVRYDTRLKAGEDTEFYYAKLNANRLLWKDNRYMFKAYGVAGGEDSVIGHGVEEKKMAIELINKKYGRKLMELKPNGTEKIVVPIKGP